MRLKGGREVGQPDPPRLLEARDAFRHHLGIPRYSGARYAGGRLIRGAGGRRAIKLADALRPKRTATLRHDERLNGQRPDFPALRDSAKLAAGHAQIIISGTIGTGDLPSIHTQPECAERLCHNPVHRLKMGAVLRFSRALRKNEGDVDDAGIERYGRSPRVAHANLKAFPLKLDHRFRSTRQQAVAQTEDERFLVPP